MALEEAENEIREAVKEWYFSGAGTSSLIRRTENIIRRALTQIRSEDLREVARVSLTAFMNRQRQTIAAIGRGRLFLFLCMARLTQVGGESPSYIGSISKAKATRYVASMLPAVQLPQSLLVGVYVNNYGTPLGMYMKDYMEKHVQPVFERLLSQEPMDYTVPENIKRKGTLRNRAEIEARYQGHMDRMADFKSRGVKLVIVSAHADCSERCRPWQGKVYSLDGTTGVTDDGRTYQPIERATDIFVMTKNNVWKNGLFGFNCRHTMTEYKPGLRLSIPSASVERKQYALTVRQRALERRVRAWKTRESMYKGIYTPEYERSHKYAVKATREYEAFCRANRRAIERSRLTI